MAETGGARNNTGAFCARGHENSLLIARLEKAVEDMRRAAEAEKERRVDWEHRIDLRVSCIEWRAGYWAALGAILGGAAVQVAVRLLFT